MGEDVSPPGSRYESRYIGIPAAPHPGVFPDRTGEGERTWRQSGFHLPKSPDSAGRRVNPTMDFAERCDQRDDVSNVFRFTDEHRRKFFDGLAKLSEVLL